AAVPSRGAAPASAAAAAAATDTTTTPGHGGPSAENPDLQPDQPETPHPRAPTEVRRPRHYVVPLVEGMFHLPGGTFTMGGDGPTSQPNERPPHAVTIDPFWIDRTEVTVSELRSCIHRGACSEPTFRGGSCTFARQDGSLPVNCASWELADAYCRA